MHPYEVEIYVRERLRETQMTIEGLPFVRPHSSVSPRWQRRCLWGLGHLLIRCGRLLCQASGVAGPNPEARNAVGIQPF